MAKTLLEYAQWLDERGLLWPAAPERVPAKATPFLAPLAGIRAVAWSVYGTLLTIADGRFDPLPAEKMRMEVALDKTIHEFAMWHSMSRKPGAPWEYMFSQYQRLVEDARMAGSGHKGEACEVNLARIWRVLIGRLQEKDYIWDESLLGPLGDFSEKVAYFFHSALQGIGIMPNALDTLRHVRASGCEQAIIADGQPHTLVQLLKSLRSQGELHDLAELFTGGSICLSFAFGVRQPAPSLFSACAKGLAQHGIAPAEILYISSRHMDELAVAKQAGFRTALYAGDKNSLQASGAQVRDSALAPDRILTDLRQVRQILKRE
jgi:FMN phosphatase YigB (HAD superfamily)